MKSPSLALAAILALTSGAVGADTRHGDPPPGTIGLLSLPEIAGGELGYCGDVEPVPVPLYETPEAPPSDAWLLSEAISADGACRGERTRWHHLDRPPQDFELMEHGYEAAALIVLEARPPWYRIALNESSAWVRGERGRYRDLVDLYREGLNRLTEAWDGELCDGPDPERACATTDAERLRREQRDSVEVLDWALMPDGLWLEVEVIVSPCLTDLQQTLPVRGWLPAHGRNRTPNVWFHARGC